jgi:amphi-Trp domain-containing protein
MSREPYNPKESTMGKENKREVEFEGTMDVKQATEYLEKLLASFKAGTVCVQRGSAAVALKPEPVVNLEVEAKQKESKESLSIKLKWRKVEPMQPEAVGPELEISDKEPPPPEPEPDAGADDAGPKS